MSIDPTRRTRHAHPFISPPTHCEVCGTKLVKQDRDAGFDPRSGRARTVSGWACPRTASRAMPYRHADTSTGRRLMAAGGTGAFEVIVWLWMDRSRHGRGVPRGRSRVMVLAGSKPRQATSRRAAAEHASGAVHGFDARPSIVMTVAARNAREWLRTAAALAPGEHVLKLEIDVVRPMDMPGWRP